MGISGISGSSYPYQNHLNKINTSQEKTANVKPGYKSSPAECETCKGRKYQDGSNEADVSFKNATHVSPNAAGAAVRCRGTVVCCFCAAAAACQTPYRHHTCCKQCQKPFIFHLCYLHISLGVIVLK